MPARFIDSLFIRRQQVDQERPDPRFVQHSRYVFVSRTMTAAAASMREDNDRAARFGNCQVAFNNLAVGDFDHDRFHTRASLLCNKLRTSWSEVCSKSSYHMPTA